MFVDSNIVIHAGVAQKKFKGVKKKFKGVDERVDTDASVAAPRPAHLACLHPLISASKCHIGVLCRRRIELLLFELWGDDGPVLCKQSSVDG